MTKKVSIPLEKTPFDRLILDVVAPVLRDTLVSNPVMNALVRINEQRTIQRIESFTKHLNPHSQVITVEKAKELQALFETPTGQDILADYIDAVTTTSCERAHLALALLLAGDQEFQLTQIEIQIFVNAMAGMNDDLMDFFLAAGKLKTANHHPAYPLVSITEIQLKEMNQQDLGSEVTITFVNELIKRRLFLPDPPSGPEMGANDGVWWITFGVSEMTLKFIQQLKKAENMLVTIEDK